MGRHAAVAVLLSFIYPGLGQIYLERIGRGLAIGIANFILFWFWILTSFEISDTEEPGLFLVFIWLSAGVLMLALWVFSMYDAYVTAKQEVETAVSGKGRYIAFLGAILIVIMSGILLGGDEGAYDEFTSPTQMLDTGGAPLVEPEESATVEEYQPLSSLEPAAPEVNVTYYTPYPLAFYNVYYELDMPDVTFEIYNPGKTSLRVKVVSEYQGVSYPAVTTEIVEPEEWKIINQTIRLKYDEISRIRTKTRFMLYYKVEYEENEGWRVLDEQTVPVDVYPMDTMVWAILDDSGHATPMYDFIAVFVTPKAEAVQELLAIASTYHPDGELTGYQCSECSAEYEWVEHAAQQVEAIYEALQDSYGMSYVSTPTAFGEDEVQKVRLPEESLRFGTINCIDGAVLFASAIEALGMKPYIVILPEHAFVAWDVKGDGSLIDALETTLIGSASFEEAWRSGREALEQHWDELFDDDPWNGVVVDVAAEREEGVLPVK